MSKTMVHTHVHSDFSILDGCQRVTEIASRVKELGQPAVALTDHGVIGNMLAFEKACKEEGVNHIHGIEVYVAKNMAEKSKDRYHTVLLAKNNIGLNNIIRLSSLGFIDGFYYRPRIDLNLLKEYREGLIVTTACTSGLIPNFITEEQWDKAVEACKWFLKYFPDDFYLEMMPNVGRKDKDGQKEQRHQVKVNEGLCKLSKELSIPLIATNDAHYSTKEGSETHEVLLCISSKKRIDSPDRWKPDIVESYIKSRTEMEATFTKYYPFIPKTVVRRALDSTLEIMNRCETTIDTQACIIPSVEVPEKNMSQLDYLKRLTKAGWKSKLIDSGQMSRVAMKLGKTRKEIFEVYKERVNRELKAIDEQDYASYFLVVWDLYEWVKKQDIFCGPGRGSSAGSLVCYLLNITQVDPIEYDLLFERFLRPGRVTAPDIDMDFQDDRRDEIKEYLIAKWGRECVANIGSYGTEKGKAALKDVGRVFGVPWKETQSVTDMIVQRSSGDARVSNTIEDTFEESEIAQEYSKRYPDVLKHAKVIEGRIRQRGVHASGIVIAPFPLIDMIPLERHGGRETGTIATGLNWMECDELGLLKIDLLGLSTLTVIKQTLDLIESRTGEKIDMYSIPADDPKVMEKFDKGDCIGAFQFDSIGMAKMCIEAPMENLDDIAVVNALYRPGGMRSGLAGRYLDRKAGREKRKSVHPIYNRITGITEGCIVYQEQVMALFAEMGLWDGIEVDSGRKMIAKSHGVEELNRQRDHFVNGALSNPEYLDGLTDEQLEKPEHVADSIYTTILHFGSYGFNKSHAVAYGLISYWTMYLKTHYPLEFYSVLISREKDDEDISRFIRAMRKEGIDLLPPDINKSMVDFNIEKKGIRAGLAKIKNVGDKAIVNILEVRPFRNIDDFLGKVTKRVVNKRVVINLIKAGAFDSMHPDRNKLLNQFLIGYGKKGKISDVEIDIEPLGEEGLIRMAMEVLPIPPKKYVLEYYSDILDHLEVPLIKVGDIDQYSSKIVYIVGTVTDIKYNKVGDFDLKERSEADKKTFKNWGKRYANINLEDETGFRRHRFSPEVYEEYKSLLEKGVGTPVIIRSRVDIFRETNYVLEMVDLDELRKKFKERKEGISIEFDLFEKVLIDSPLSKYGDVIEAYNFMDIVNAKGKEIKVAGMVASVAEHVAKNGLMAFVSLEDKSGFVDLLVWPDAYIKFKDIINSGKSLAVKAVRVDGGKYAIELSKGCKVVALESLRKGI